MALRLMDASSSLCPPDRKVTPGEQGPKQGEGFSQLAGLPLGASLKSRPTGIRVVVGSSVSAGKMRGQASPGTAGGTVRRSAVTVAMAISSCENFWVQAWPGVTMLGFSKVPSK
jgi:hypothetical protein